MATCRLAVASLFIVLSCTLGSLALPSPASAPSSAPRNAIHTENDLLDSIYTDCLRKDTVSCLKYKLFSFVDKMLGHKDTITVTEGVQIIKTGDELQKDGAPRAFNADDSIDSLIFGRLQDFLESHTIKVDLKGSEIVNAVSSTARSLNDIVSEEEEQEELVEEGRRKNGGGGGGKKGNKMMGAMMMAAGLKAAILGKLALAAIALIAGKALLIGKIALVLSAIIGLKKLVGQQGGKHVTYEVVSHPQHSSSHVSSHETIYSGGSSGGGGYGGDLGGGYSGGSSSGHGGWGRSLDTAQNMAYRAQIPIAKKE